MMTNTGACCEMLRLGHAYARVEDGLPTTEKLPALLPLHETNDQQSMPFCYASSLQHEMFHTATSCDLGPNSHDDG